MSKKIFTLIISTTVVILLLLATLLSWWWQKPKLIITQVSYAQLPGFNQAKLTDSWPAFIRSCHRYLRLPANKSVGTTQMPLKAGDWYELCHHALNLQPISTPRLQEFFKRWLQPYAWQNRHRRPGLFTGYYLISIPGALQANAHYHIPIYGPPRGLVSASGSITMNVMFQTVFRW